MVVDQSQRLSSSRKLTHLRFFSLKDLLFLETSAATSVNVADSFFKCARAILSKIESGLFDEFFRDRRIISLGSIDPHRMYSGIQCNRSPAANRSVRDPNQSLAIEGLPKSSTGCGSC